MKSFESESVCFVDSISPKPILEGFFSNLLFNFNTFERKNLYTKSDQLLWLLRFRRQDQPNRLMPYASFVIRWHFRSMDAYDVNIWHQSICSILVSKIFCISEAKNGYPVLIENSNVELWKNFWVGFWSSYCLCLKENQHVNQF